MLLVPAMLRDAVAGALLHAAWTHAHGAARAPVLFVAAAAWLLVLRHGPRPGVAAASLTVAMAVLVALAAAFVLQPAGLDAAAAAAAHYL